MEASPPSPGYFARLFLGPKPVGRRPIIDLKRLNSLFIDCPRFRMDTLRDASLLLQPWSWAAYVDLEGAFFPRLLAASSASVGAAGFGSAASFPSVCASLYSSSRE